MFNDLGGLYSFHYRGMTNANDSKLYAPQIVCGEAREALVYKSFAKSVARFIQNYRAKSLIFQANFSYRAFVK
ncbi:MAG: hypothetical protein JWQ54_2200 [Mucilaginibacter sp.]|nr:hypothetical protein [Mucilaginibacter sp.]